MDPQNTLDPKDNMLKSGHLFPRWNPQMLEEYNKN